MTREERARQRRLGVVESSSTTSTCLVPLQKGHRPAPGPQGAHARKRGSTGIQLWYFASGLSLDELLSRSATLDVEFT